MKHKSLTVAMVLLGLSLSLSVWGDPSTLAISSAKVDGDRQLVNHP